MTSLLKRVARGMTMILGLSDEERDLKSMVRETVRKKKAEAMSIDEARTNLEQAHRDMHSRTGRIRGRLASHHDAEERRSSPGNQKPVGQT